MTLSQTHDHYRTLINKEIESYVQHNAKRVQDVYGAESLHVASAFNEILQRGGKRIRGVLTMVGYQMCGGTDQDMIVKAARAIEMMHAQMLIIDDIQDNSDLRRGGPSAHKLLEAQYGSEHAGRAMALNAALLGSHGASMTLGMLDVPDELRVKALNIMNHTIMVTAHGQTNDIANELSKNVTQQDIDNVLQWKTAHYTVLNPIHMGMVLAGAGCEDTNAITTFALNAGKAFQMKDDLLVVSNDASKNAIDDIREGKQTILTLHVHEHAPEQDVLFFNTCLGNPEISVDDFYRCQEILRSSGAVAAAEKLVKEYTQQALDSLRQYQDRWDPDSVDILVYLATY